MSLQIKKRSLAPGVIDYFDNQIDSVDLKIDQEIIDRQAVITATENLISSEESRALTAEDSLSNRLSPMEEILEFEKEIAYNDNAQIYADAQPGFEDAAQRPGWYFKNTVAGQKVNWYLFDGVNQANISLNDFSAYTVMTFDSVSPVRHPILAVYTMPTGTNDIAPGFAHSRVVYSSMSITPVAGKKYLVYFGQNPVIHPELPRIQLGINPTQSVGERLSTERVLTTSFGSDSGAAVNTVQFLVESFGINSPNFKAEAKLKIKVASLKALQDSFSGTVQQSYVDLQDSSTLSSAQAYTDQKVSDLVNSSPAALDTLNELAAALGNDANFSTTVINQISAVDAKTDQEILDRQAADLSSIQESKNYTDAQIAAIGPVDISGLETRVTTAESDIVALEVYSKNIVHVDAVNGVDEIGRGSMLRPFKTINFAYSQVPSLGNPSNTTYNANVGKFVTEKLIIDLAPGRYTENVVLGFKRARVQLRGEGATIIGDVKTSVKLADFPCAALENMKASFPAPFTGVSAFMNIEISGNAGGGTESDQTSSVFVITGQASLAFEESTMAGFGTGLNWDSSHGQFYAALDSVSVGNWVVTTSYTANMARALPGGVIEVDSSNIAASSATYRMFFGAVPYSYLTDFATWNVASKGTANLAPNSGLTLKAHNSTFGNVIGPALTLGEIDGCRIYDIDRTMRGTVSNGSILGSTSTSYIGFVNNQFRIYSGSGDLASAYKLGQAVGATRYKMDSVSHTTLSFNRSSSGVLTARTLDLGAGVSFDFLDDARSISVADPATNYTRSASTVDASLEGIDNALALKASIASVTAGDAASLLDSKAYTDLKISQIPSVDTSSLETIANVDSKDAAKLVEAKAYADQVSALAQDNAEDYIDSQIAAIPGVDLSGYYNKTEADAVFALKSDAISIEESLQATQQELSQVSMDAFNAIGSETTRAMTAESALESRIEVLEAQVDGPSFANGSVIVGVELSFIDLDRTYLKLMSCSVGRLMVHENEDFTVSVVDGKTRLTWIGSLVNPSGAEAIETGDKVFFVAAF